MRMLVAAVLLSAIASPAFAADKIKEPAKEETAAVAKADPAKVAKAADVLIAIEKDAAKLKTYCEMQELFNKADEAEDKKKEKDAEKFVADAEAKGKTLGDDFKTVMNLEDEIDPETAEGKKFFGVIESLEKKCEKK
ncbi:MAG: hypothetical protein P8Y36_01085 [Alphaproteobacteria bacterium]